MTKRCFTCLQDLPLEAFGKNRARVDGLQARCRECRKAEPARPDYQREYRLLNRDRLHEYDRERHAANPEINRDRARRWRTEFPERKKAADDRWRAQNPERVLENSRAWKARNPEKRAEVVKRYATNHPEVARMTQSRRRARLKSLPNERVTMAQIIERDGTDCYLCGLGVPVADIHIDHVVPISRGGAHVASNLRVTHSRCNQLKAAITPDEFWERQHNASA